MAAPFRTHDEFRSSAANVSTEPAGVLVAGSTCAGHVTFRLTNVGGTVPVGGGGNVSVSRYRALPVAATDLPSPSKYSVFEVPNVTPYWSDVGFALGVARRSAITLENIETAAVCETAC